MADGVVFEDGHFHEHNEAVLADIASKETIKSSLVCYITHLCDDAVALIDAGASAEQQKASVEAARAQFLTRAWPAIVEKTNYKDRE